MAIIHDLNTPGVGSAAKTVISVAFWSYYDDHKDDRMFSVKFWIISKTVYWRDGYDIFVLLFGAHP